MYSNRNCNLESKELSISYKLADVYWRVLTLGNEKDACPLCSNRLEKKRVHCFTFGKKSVPSHIEYKTVLFCQNCQLPYLYNNDLFSNGHLKKYTNIESINKYSLKAPAILLNRVKMPNLYKKAENLQIECFTNSNPSSKYGPLTIEQIKSIFTLYFKKTDLWFKNLLGDHYEEYIYLTEILYWHSVYVVYESYYRKRKEFKRYEKQLEDLFSLLSYDNLCFLSANSNLVQKICLCLFDNKGNTVDIEHFRMNLEKLLKSFIFSNVLFQIEGGKSYYNKLVETLTVNSNSNINVEFSIFEAESALDELCSWYLEKKFSIKTTRNASEAINACKSERGILPVTIYSSDCLCTHKHPHNIEKISVEINKMIGKLKAKISVFYCKKCDKFFVYESTFDDYLDKYGPLVLAIEYISDCDYYEFNGYQRYDLKEESRFKKYGYSVSAEALPKDIRRELIIGLVENNIITLAEFVKHINWLIHMQGNNPRQKRALMEWKDDLRFLMNYDEEKQKIFEKDPVFYKKVSKPYTTFE